MTAWSQGTWKKCNYPLGQTYKVGEIVKTFVPNYENVDMILANKTRKKTFTPLPELTMLIHAPVV